MIRFRFGRDDLLRTRFAISPLIEIAGATYVVRRPDLFPLHRRWAAWARPRVESIDLTLLYAVSPFGVSYWPNFDAPPPTKPHPDIAEEVARVAAAPPREVVRDIELTYPAGSPADAQPFLDDPVKAVQGLAVQMRTFWDAVIEPQWTRITAILEAEIALRARRLVAAGSVSAFEGLDPTVSWHGDELRVHPTAKAPADVDLAGRGLLLIPSVFAWDVWPRSDPPWDPALTYQPPGIGDLWNAESGKGDALDALIGQRRAMILRELERPAATLAVARRLGVSAGGVSEHLRVLYRAGLVTRRRDGREVVYSRTVTGDTLCTSAR
jgi:DNA-binding transcriptional ArsR family regulator